MPKREAPVDLLARYLPQGTYAAVMNYLHQHKVHLTIARERKSILGDYRHRTFHENHRISVNGNLNPYAFLVTLLHELAHLLTFERFGNGVASHGKEWKATYSALLDQFLRSGVFPEDIQRALMQSLANPAASSCAEDDLLRVLRRYDQKTNGYILVEELPQDGLFRTEDNRVFRRGEKLRKRFRCVEIETGKVFLFSPVYEVTPVQVS